MRFQSSFLGLGMDRCTSSVLGKKWPVIKQDNLSAVVLKT
jgi:hypothetical protein